jgi:hypothetical protein
VIQQKSAAAGRWGSKREMCPQRMKTNLEMHTVQRTKRVGAHIVNAI